MDKPLKPTAGVGVGSAVGGGVAADKKVPVKAGGKPAAKRGLKRL
jgi:hypothetical protein